MPAFQPGTFQPLMGAGTDDTFPQDYPLPSVNDNSAAIGQGLGQTLSNLQPWQLVYDPFQFQRPQYMDMLSKLAQDPSSVTTTPWYTAGIESVKRGMSKGYLDSGNMALALNQYGQDQYYKQLAMLAQLAGGTQGPTNVGSSIVGGRTAGADLISKALGTQRYQDLQRLMNQARGGSGSGGSRPFWGPPDVSGTKLPPYPQSGGGGGRGGQPGQQNPNDPDSNWQQEMEDTFGMPFDEIMDMLYGDGSGDSSGGGSGGLGVPTPSSGGGGGGSGSIPEDYSSYNGDDLFGSSDFGFDGGGE